jgi:iron complex outermembrane recepter protein
MSMERVSIQAALLVAVSGGVIAGALPGWASDRSQDTSNIPRISDRDRPATTLKEWRAQIDAATTQVTGITLNRTDTELEIVLQTADGKLLQVDASKFRTEGNSLIADIPNAVLALTDAPTFTAENPTADIATVQVVQQGANRIRISVTGNNALPKTEVTLKTGGLAYSLNPEADEPDEEIVVTGEGQQGYRATTSSTILRTNAALRDTPQSIQVIPQQVLQDQRADVVTALRNAPSVRNAAPANFNAPRILVRGFFSSTSLDGFVNRVFNGVGANIGPDLTGIDRIEVIQGPNAVLFGSLSPGGTVNYVTKKPLREPFNLVEANFGSYNFYRGELDISGPADAEKKVLYRFNTSYRSQGSFLEGNRLQNLVVAPVISAALGKNTTFSIESVYKALGNDRSPTGLPAVGTVLPNPNGKISRNRNINEGFEDNTQFRITAALDHRFSEAWSFNTRFRYDALDTNILSVQPGALRSDNRTLPRSATDIVEEYREYRSQTNVVGKFLTGSIKHELLFGLDLGRNTFDPKYTDRLGVPAVDIFNPIYGRPLGTRGTTTTTSITTDELGILLQDQIILADNLRLLLTGRFDAFTQTGDFDSPSPVQSGDAFSPRVGIVYQPIPPISLYANFAQSFEPTIGLSATNTPFQPSRGTQYEVGVKADINSRLTTTLAFYDITRTNVLTPDPVNPDFSVQTGEQNGRGAELNIAGEILPGWNIFAGYAYNDSRITESNNLAEVGKRFQRTTPHTASLWTTYQLQSGDLQGLGVGLGLFYVGDRAGDNANTFELPSYLTTDLALFYRRDRLRVALNIKNLFDITYFDGAFSRNRVSYGEPFTVQGTISWQF